MSDYINRKRFPFKLLVEGKDDLYVVTNIRDRHHLVDNFEIVDCEGVDKMPDQIIARIKQQKPTINTIGIILDADTNLNARWESLKTLLQTENYAVSSAPDINGTVIEGTGRNPTIGVWLMPDNLQAGMLKDFVRYLIPINDLLQPFVEQILGQIEAEPVENRYDPAFQRAKAFIHTWLAWQKDPGKPMGTAISATFLDHNAELCLRFVDWLNRLFNAR